MSKLVYREKEIKTLQDEYNRESSSFVVLYGRRRVGKTTLIREFLKDKKNIYFLATEESEVQNRNAFKHLVAELTDNQYLDSLQVNDWNYLFHEIVKVSKKEKVVIVIDEFQYLGKINPAFPSIFQKIWDMILKDENIMVVLCGSLISMMESQTLHYESPLYGRRTSQIKLQQIPFSYYHEFYPKKKRYDLICLYAITGGVPKYIELFYDEQDIYTSIENSILSKNSFLYDEPNFLLQKEVSEIGSYFSILRAISLGNRKLSQIASILEIKQTSISKYLQTLINLDILEREVPITEQNPERSKKGLYKIKDNFLKFWFSFVYPNNSYLEMEHSDFVLNKIKKTLIDNHVSFVYEDVCIDYIRNKFSVENPWNIYLDKIGRWWDGNNEIDVVAYDSDGNDIVFCECKFWKDKVGCNILYELEEKAKYVNWKNDKRNNYYIIFSINGHTDELIALAKERNDVVLLG